MARQKVDARAPSGGKTVASIFVNRLQFAPHEDFDAYPRTLENDCALLEANGCDVVFAPSEKDLYPEPQVFKVHPPAELADILEGAFRPGFFVGVSTVVHKLFNIVQPNLAVFGKKDYQQLLVISHWTKINQIPIEIVGCETIRTNEGLAMSSRNSRLSELEKSAALAISKSLYFLRERKGIESLQDTLAFVKNQFIEPAGVRLEYLCCADSESLEPFNEWPTGSCVLLVAGWIGGVRLIDELEVN